MSSISLSSLAAQNVYAIIVGTGTLGKVDGLAARDCAIDACLATAESGKARVLAVTSGVRAPLLPEIPTVRSAGDALTECRRREGWAASRQLLKWP